MTVNPASSNFTPQLKQARNLSQIFNRKSSTHNTMLRQSLHLIQSESRCRGCGYKIKKTKTPRKMQKSNNLLRTKRILNIKMSANGRLVFAFLLPGGAARLRSRHDRQLRHCLCWRTLCHDDDHPIIRNQ